MKNNLFIIIVIILTGCKSNFSTFNEIPCPDIFFSKEHKNYIAGNQKSLSIEDLSFKANINNFQYNGKCLSNNEFFKAQISILFVIEPNNSKTGDFQLPYYVALADTDDNLIDIQFFKVDGKFEIDKKQKKYLETELADSINLETQMNKIQLESDKYIIIGFMLDSEKLNLLN